MEGYQTPPTPPIAGPRMIGHLATIAVGAYTEIVDIIAPEEADAGDLVTVKVKVKNLWTDELATKVGGWLDSGEEEIWFSPEYAWLDPGEIYSFTYKFTMPDNAVHIYVWSYYWYWIDEEEGIGEWYADDDGSVYIALATLGTISKIELEHDETRTDIPTHGIPLDERGLVHIWGRNDTDSYQTLGIGWVVTDPDGQEVERHEDDWAAGWVGPGEDREFIGGRFNLDKAGAYRIAIALYMNSADPVEVDRYEGILCTVALGGVGIELKAGGNFVVYPGKVQSAAAALASIISYIEVAYYYNNLTKLYEQVIYTTTMVPYGCYWIEVTQDCTWTYGVDATPPTSIQLYYGWNHVAYLGPVQSAEKAFVSIMPYLEIVFYYDNITKNYEEVITSTIMVPRTLVYAINVTQDCVWIFEAPPEFAGTISRKELEYDESRAGIPVY